MSNVLVLGTDVTLHSRISELLEPEGFRVTTADSITELGPGKDISEIDLFVVDIVHSDNALALIRQLINYSGSGIIILSAQNCEAACVAVLEQGADDYIGKPFMPLEFAARVKAVCRRTAGRRQQSPVPNMGLVVGEYTLVPESRSVLDRRGNEVSLTTAEYNIFSVLAYHQGAVLTRDEIIGLSKGRDWRCYERSVDGLISRLRRKLPGRAGVSHFIKTVHGTGYTIAKI